MATAYLRFHTDRNFSSIPVTAGGTVAKGDLLVLEDQVGFYMEDAVSGDSVAICVEAHKADFPKKTGVTIAAGDDVYFDDVHMYVTLTTSHRPVGYAIKAAGSSATRVWIRFKQEATGGVY